MLPQIDPAILKSNPQFAKLHTQLCMKFLNLDGSTKNRPSRTEEDDLRQVAIPLLFHIFRDFNADDRPNRTCTPPSEPPCKEPSYAQL